MRKRMFVLLLITLLTLCGCDSYRNNKKSLTDIKYTSYFKEHLDSLDELPKEVDNLEKNVDRYPAKLIVNGKDISKSNYVMLVAKEKNEECYFELPLIAIFKELGYKINWEDETTAVIKKGSKKTYILRAHAASLIEKGRNWDLILFMGGGALRWKFEDGVFILSDDYVVSLLTTEFHVSINCDIETKTVKING